MNDGRKTACADAQEMFLCYPDRAADASKTNGTSAEFARFVGSEFNASFAEKNLQIVESDVAKFRRIVVQSGTMQAMLTSQGDAGSHKPAIFSGALTL